MTRITARSAASPVTVFVICWLGLLADGYDLYVYGATLPGFIGQAPWNVTPATAGAVGSFALVGMLLGSMIAGTLTDRLGRRRLLIGSLALFSLAMLACAFAPNFSVFGALRFVAGIGIGGLLPTAVALTNEFASARKKSIVLGLVLTGPAIGSLLAAVVAVNLLEDHGVRPVYAIGAASALLIPFALRLLPESPAYLRAVGRHDAAAELSSRYGMTSPDDVGRPPAQGTAPALPRGLVAGLFRDRNLAPTLGMWLLCLLSLLTIFGLTTWLPQMMRQAGFAQGSAISFLLTYSIGAIAGTVVAAVVGQLTAPKVMAIIGFVAAAAALLVASQASSPAVLTTAFLIAGFGGMGTQNMINDHVAQYYPAALRATGLGWALAAGRVGAIIGPSYGAWAVTTGGGVEFAALAFAVPALLGAVIALGLPRRQRIVDPAKLSVRATKEVPR
ncbi:MFS transporter [Saxibacter everestensis]|uniref:MFS transporter n=1 Tax=Saxibacter everestensis TaxID=2909229 RepID=A0ABY8QSB1_9MICO|nr:MFS transporter [Brevibacteriaceae bacterium ZFBP1038]